MALCFVFAIVAIVVAIFAPAIITGSGFCVGWVIIMVRDIVIGAAIGWVSACVICHPECCMITFVIGAIIGGIIGYNRD